MNLDNKIVPSMFGGWENTVVYVFVAKYQLSRSIMCKMRSAMDAVAEGPDQMCPLLWKCDMENLEKSQRYHTQYE